MLPMTPEEEATYYKALSSALLGRLEAVKAICEDDDDGLTTDGAYRAITAIVRRPILLPGNLAPKEDKP